MARPQNLLLHIEIDDTFDKFRGVVGVWGVSNTVFVPGFFEFGMQILKSLLAEYAQTSSMLKTERLDVYKQDVQF